MDKLITRMPIILIGLSISFLISSCTLFNSDESLVKYSDRYINNTNQEINLVFKSSIEGESNFRIASGDYIDRIKITWNDENTIKQFIDELYGVDSDETTIELILGTETIKSWNGPPSSMGNDINTPFNYDSWKITDSKNVVEFTINNSDLD